MLNACLKEEIFPDPWKVQRLVLLRWKGETKKYCLTNYPACEECFQLSKMGKHNTSSVWNPRSSIPHKYNNELSKTDYIIIQHWRRHQALFCFDWSTTRLCSRPPYMEPAVRRGAKEAPTKNSETNRICGWPYSGSSGQTPKWPSEQLQWVHKWPAPMVLLLQKQCVL